MPRAPETARAAIRDGHVPSSLRVGGNLSLANLPTVRRLPQWLVCEGLDVSDCVNLHWLPRRLRCQTLLARRTQLTVLPENMRVSHTIDLSGCRLLRAVPPLRLHTLVLRGCSLLRELPDGTAAAVLDLSGCHRMRAMPLSAARTARRLTLRDCAGLEGLPDRV
ncbi:MAG: hypothetical protein K1X74_13115 [Pirellulales bacterium]|nr:hypothetical protein [Pirellulales bacterium]